MNEIAIRDSAAMTLPAKIEYARFLAKSGLLPKDFREHPENVLYAYEMGELLGLHPMAAITGIHVIEGKPSISAGLISALVRRAGHRIRVQGDGEKARCQITRSDDPSFTYTAVWDMTRAKQAGLLGKTNWQRYPAAMLKARAVSECARDACQEVLLGIRYTPDEMGADDDGGEIIHDGFATLPNGAVDGTVLSEEAKDAAGLMTRPQRIEHAALIREVDETERHGERLNEMDPADPWVTEPAPEKPASKAALERLDKIIQKHPLGPDEDVHALLNWLAGTQWTATASQVKVASTFLEDALKAAGGDTAAAAEQIWLQHRKAAETP